MTDIKMEDQESVAAAPAIINEQIKTETEVDAPASIKQESSTVAEPEVKEEKQDDVEMKIELKEEKSDSEVKPEIKDNVEAANGDVKKEGEDEKKDKKFDPNEPRFYDNGVLKTNRNEIWGKNNSKYDASVLPASDDVNLVRRQV